MWDAWGVKCQLVAECGVDRHSNTRKGFSGNRVTVGRNGVVAANINAREIVVLGKVRGNLTASDRVDIRSDGSLTGDVVAARISIEDGAFFKGGIDIRKAGQKPNGEEAKP